MSGLCFQERLCLAAAEAAPEWKLPNLPMREHPSQLVEIRVLEPAQVQPRRCNTA